MWQESYESPQSQLWFGRVDQGTKAIRYHQCVKLVDLASKTSITTEKKNIAIVGFKSDEGVRRNKGRPGAYDGPDTFRKKLGSLSFHESSKIDIYDFGNICVDDGDLEKGQTALADLLFTLREKGFTPFVIGGGHEVSWGHYQGLAKSRLVEDLQIINFDAHFDLRPKDKNGMGSSGTPFKQISEYCEEKSLDFNYSCYGIQEISNHGGLFETARKLKVEYILAEEFATDTDKLMTQIKKDVSKAESIYMTICLDVFADYVAPGVSARTALGLVPMQVLALLKYIVESGKLVAFDIAELSPVHDKDDKTASLAASLFAQVLSYQSKN